MQEKLSDQITGYEISTKAKAGGLLIEALQTVLFALALSIVVYLFFAIPNKVEGESMFPYLEDDDILLTNKFIQISGGEGNLFSDYDYQRGDLVVFQKPEAPDLVKRIIAVPGDRIRIEDGQVILNDNVLIEEYLPDGRRTAPGDFMENGVEREVPENEFFVMGDNRSNSRDSRTSSVGFVRREYIKGTPFLRVLPLNRFGLLNAGTVKQIPVEDIVDEG